VPGLSKSLPGADKILSPTSDTPKFDVMMVVDVSTFDRIGDMSQWISEDCKVITVDHHVEEHPEGTLGLIDTSYAAAGEMVADLFTMAGIDLTQDAAHCIYVAQITDTGNYRFSNTNARSHRIAATLHDTGLDTSLIYQEIFGNVALPRFELMRCVLARAEFSASGRLAHAYVTAQDLKEAGASKEHLDNLANMLRDVEGVEVGIVFHGVDAETTKLSFRSGPNFDSASFLQRFGGGGHAAAAGATIQQGLEAVQKDVLSQCVQVLGEEQ
jgi:phosphoesterase RecJ-like protein